MVTRNDFINKLWQAYVLTGNKAYTEKLRFFILDWIEKNPITQQGTDATRTIDTGIRCMNWSTLLLHLLADDTISEADAKLIINFLKEQYTLITDSNYIVNKVPMFQLRKEAPVSEDVAVAWNVEKSDGTKQTLILWNRETYRGDKLFSCHGRSIYGKAIVLSWKKGDFQVNRLKT